MYKLERWLGVLLCVLSPVLGEDQAATPSDFSSLSLERLSSIKITSVAKKQQRLSQTAAAVYVITHEDIRRSGMTSVPEVLRLAPGLHVARLSSSQWSVSSRGFNGRFANKLLVLIDGRSIYTPVFSGVYWDMAMPMMDDIERIEVIRGPGATIWGANAVMGVINIITKTARATRGTLITAGGGSFERAFGAVRHGGQIGSANYRAYAAGAMRGQLDNLAGQGVRDNWSNIQGGFRLDATRRNDSFSVIGDIFQNDRGENGILPSLTNPGLDTTHSQERGRQGSMSGEWQRRLSETDFFRVRSYVDAVSRPEPTMTTMETHTWDSEMQYDGVVANIHSVAIGGGVRLVTDSLHAQTYSFMPANMSYQTYNMFGQDEIHLFDDRLLATFGAKVEHNTFGGWGFQPNARLLWAPTNQHSVWFSAARALRSPTRYERSVDADIFAMPASPQTFGLPTLVSIIGNPSFQNEAIDDYEVGYRAEFSKRFSLDISLFHDKYHRLRMLEMTRFSLLFAPTPHISVPFTFNNDSNGSSQGAEVTFVWQPLKAWKLAGSFSHQDANLAFTNASDSVGLFGAIPAPVRNQWKVQSYANLTRSLQLDVLFFHIGTVGNGSFQASNQPIPSYATADVRLGWTVNPSWELSLSGQNLFQPRHLELIPEALSREAYVTRGIYMKSTWRF